MKTERNILIAFVLNLAFSVFEFVGGMLTGSVAIASDAVHDLGDAASIGISYFLEKKSRKEPDESYTYGYGRFSVVGGLVTTLILLVGALVMILHAVGKIVTPTQIHYDGMLLFAVVGVCVNSTAAFLTREKGSLNQKAVNLHMLEDVLGWVVVLVGAIVMKFTDFALLDPILSIGVSLFILVSAVRTLKEILYVFLEKAPGNVNAVQIQERLGKMEGVLDVHHVHLWSMDGQKSYATMHVVADGDPHEIKDQIRKMLREIGIDHMTLELEAPNEHCHERQCHVDAHGHGSHGHHHHHHH